MKCRGKRGHLQTTRPVKQSTRRTGLTEKQTPVSERELARENEMKSWVISDDWRGISKQNNAYGEQIHRIEHTFLKKNVLSEPGPNGYWLWKFGSNAFEWFKLSKSFSLCVLRYGIEKKITLGFTDALHLKIHFFYINYWRLSVSVELPMLKLTKLLTCIWLSLQQESYT